MRQSRLYEYFNCHPQPCPPPSGISFLDLPPNIRRHIYDEAGFTSGCPINLHRRKTDRHRDSLEESSESENSSRPAEVSDDDHLDWAGCSSLWYNLLQTSRDICNEVSSIIYSENRFMIHQRDGYDLRPLQNLSAKCLASLTCLIIHINVTSCDIREQCRRVCLQDDCYSCRHEKPLGKSSRADKSIISEWRRTASRLAAYIQPSRLELYFTCDTQDYETAKLVVEPISQMPTLKDCAIRLGREPNDDLQHLAEKVVLRVIGVRKNRLCSQFRFKELPKELQFRILEISDLITPHEVQWWPGKGLHMPRAISNHIDDWEGCYLSGHHSAFSSKYRCWYPPSALFLVSWEMRRDAMEVFYLNNHFVILPRGGSYPPVAETPNQVETFLFLSQVPSYAVPYLRSIEIVFPLFESDYLRSNEPGYQDWLNAIDYIARNANIPKLSITIYMSDVHKNSPVPFRWELNREQKLTIMKMYGRTLRPLARLAGLRDLFIHLSYPMYRQLWPSSDQVSENRARKTRKMERKFEQLVMGNDYDSISRGKHTICSQWRFSEQQHGPEVESWDGLYV